MKRNIGIVLVLITIAASVTLVAAINNWNNSTSATVGIIAFDTNNSTTSAGNNSSGTEDSQPLSKPIAQSKPVTRQVTSDMNEYSNNDFHFGLLFPKHLIAEEYRERDGGPTVSFQDPTTNEGFQVYVTPYSGKQIDTARFKLDEPSGVMKEPKDVLIAGAPATMFFSTNAVMGDTREVWFIHGGYLYEVTTYKELDTWLTGIMQTWKFI